MKANFPHFLLNKYDYKYDIYCYGDSIVKTYHCVVLDRYNVWVKKICNDVKPHNLVFLNMNMKKLFGAIGTF